MSTVKELVKRWYPSLDNERPFKVGAHRALDDIRDSVRELQFYRERVFIAARPVVPSEPSATPNTHAADAPTPDAPQPTERPG